MGGAPGMGGCAPMPTSQVAFIGEQGLQVEWDISGSGMFDSSPIVVPARQDFYQAAIYRLKLSNIPGRPSIVLYPTLEIAPVTPRTDAFLAHAPIPVQFTEEDFDQVTSGNFVTKVIYLPDPEFQELALAGVETLVSTRLDPGCDPIAEADRRGSILAIVRIGNKDLQPYNQGGEIIEQIIPAGHEGGASPEGAEGTINDTNVEAAGFRHHRGQAASQPCYDGGYDGYSGEVDGGMAMGNMPMGMPTAGFVPPNVPPHMIGGAPQYGLPITGTPIGLPGPPHIPLGVPAGLQNHTMKNRTRVVLPPPTNKVAITVKQRPGLNYPKPVNHIHVNETTRAPLNIFPHKGTLPLPGTHKGHGFTGRMLGDDCYSR